MQELLSGAFLFKNVICVINGRTFSWLLYFVPSILSLNIFLILICFKTANWSLFGEIHHFEWKIWYLEFFTLSALGTSLCKCLVISLYTSPGQISDTPVLDAGSTFGYVTWKDSFCYCFLICSTQMMYSVTELCVTIIIPAHYAGHQATLTKVDSVSMLSRSNCFCVQPTV